MPMRVFECDPSEVKALKKVLEYDPYLDKALNEEQLKKLRDDKLANVIFVRQKYDLREGRAIGINESKFFLYIEAPEEFLSLAEEKLKKEFKSVKRASPEIEGKFASVIKEEEEKANQGFGAIFGG